jgi:hypothetical protein
VCGSAASGPLRGSRRGPGWVSAVRKEDVIREVESMLDRGGYKVARSIVKLAEAPADTWRQVGGRRKRPMSQSEAARIVAQARERIALVDSTP